MARAPRRARGRGASVPRLEAWQISGRLERAAQVLDEAAAGTRDLIILADIQRLRAHVTTGQAPAGGAQRTPDVASVIRGSSTGNADEAFAAAMLAGATRGDLQLAVEYERRAVERIRALGETAGPLAEVRLGTALVLAGQTAAGLPLLVRCRELLADPDPLHHAAELSESASALLAVEAYALAERVLERVVGACRAAGAIGPLGQALGAQAELDARTGRWELATAMGFESVHLARDASQDALLSCNLARLARLEAAQGHQDACRAHAQEASDLATGRRPPNAKPPTES